MTVQSVRHRVALVVLDGAGLSPAGPGNGVTPRTLPTLFSLMARHGHAALEASGTAVGLAADQVGNSEVGHLTLGLGRVHMSSLSRIDRAYRSGDWHAHPLWEVLAESPRLHVVGLLSDAGVHGHWRSLVQACAVAAARGIGDVVVHPILDGVDSRAGTAPGLLRVLAEAVGRLGEGCRIGVVMGRRWFADRDGDLSATATFVAGITGCDAVPGFAESRLAAHLSRSTEASFPAHLMPGGAFVAAGEPVLLTSHRADRAVQAARLLGSWAAVHGLVSLGDAVPEQRAFFPTRPVAGGLSASLGRRGLHATRIAERCKFPHVTHFFDGFQDDTGGRRICIPDCGSSPEQQPAMALMGVIRALVASFQDPAEQVVVANIANFDQVGHTGRIDLVRDAARHVDAALDRLVAAARQQRWTLILTSDHGNAEAMLDEGGNPLGSHTCNPVPMAVSPAPGLSVRWLGDRSGLASVASSVLAFLGLEPGPDMEAPIVVPGQPLQSLQPMRR